MDEQDKKEAQDNPTGTDRRDDQGVTDSPGQAPTPTPAPPTPSTPSPSAPPSPSGPWAPSSAGGGVRPASPPPGAGTPGQTPPSQGLPKPPSSPTVGSSAPPSDAGKTEAIRPVDAGQTAKIPATPGKPDAPKAAAAGAAGAAATTRVTPKVGPEAEKLDLAEAPVRKSRAPLFLLLAAAIAVLAFVVFRPGQDQAGSKRKAGATAAASFSPPPVKVGEEVEKANLRTAVLDVTSDAKPVDANQKPDLGQKFAAVDFKLTNNDSRAVMFTAANALRLVDSAGGVHEPSAIGAPDPRFPDGIVAPAQVVQGWIAFQIPSNLSVKQLKFDARKVPKIS